jgi:hypothetical protein
MLTTKLSVPKVNRFAEDGWSKNGAKLAFRGFE